MQAGIQVQSQEVCKRAYEPEVQVTNVYMCAGVLDGSKDACQVNSYSLAENEYKYLHEKSY